jgi:hypothetical protein
MHDLEKSTDFLDKTILDKTILDKIMRNNKADGARSDPT